MTEPIDILALAARRYAEARSACRAVMQMQAGTAAAEYAAATQLAAAFAEIDLEAATRLALELGDAINRQDGVA